MAVSNKKVLKTVSKIVPIAKESTFKAAIINDENDKQIPTIKEVNCNELAIKKFHFGSFEGVQRGIGRVIHELYRGESDIKQGRAVLYGLRIMLESYRIKAENSIIMLQKMEKLEKLYKDNVKAKKTDET